MKARQRQKKHEAAIYRQIEQDMHEKIRKGIWQSEMLIPSRMQLASEYGVGLPTVERAIDRLIADDLLHAQRGRNGGTFVSKHASALLFSQFATSYEEQEDPAQNEVQGEQHVARNVQTFEMDSTPGESARKVGDLVLGIVAADFPFGPYMSGTEADWTPTVVRSLEKMFTSGGGMTTFFERFAGPEHILYSLEVALLRLVQDGVNAIVIVNVDDTLRVARQVHQIMDVSKVPVVLHTWNQPTTLLPCIAYDNVQTGYQAAAHLLKAGYRSLIFLNCREQWWAQARLAGVQAAVRAMHNHVDTFQVYYWEEGHQQEEIGEYTHDYTLNTSIGYKVGKELCAYNGWITQRKTSGHDIPGIIAPNDWIAYGLLRALREAGLQPGRDVGVIGFDDRLESCTIGLTSLVPPLAEMGKEAANMLLKHLQGKLSNQQIYLQSHLVARTSTRLQISGNYQADTDSTISA